MAAIAQQQDDFRITLYQYHRNPSTEKSRAGSTPHLVGTLTLPADATASDLYDAVNKMAGAPPSGIAVGRLGHTCVRRKQENFRVFAFKAKKQTT